MQGAQIESCEVTPTHLYLKVANRRVKAEVKVAGFVVSNSEVGLGSLRVEPLIFHLACKNGLICKDFAQKKYHVGRQVNASDNYAYELYSDAILHQLFMGGDNSSYGLVNAVTAASKIAKSYERATDLKRIGGEILALPFSSLSKDWCLHFRQS